MFGLKNPGKMMNMLKMFGIDFNTIVPQLEVVLAKEWEKWEGQAGGRLTAVVERQPDKTFGIGLYLDKGEGNLSLWKQFHFDDLAKFLNNPEKNSSKDVQPAEIRPTSGGAKPGTGIIQYEPPAERTGGAYDDKAAPAFE